jgi:hypothetical protein
VGRGLNPDTLAARRYAEATTFVGGGRTMSTFWSGTLGALVLLALSTAACAECAWILWQVPATVSASEPIATARYSLFPSDWTPQRAYTGAKECETARERLEIDEFNHGLKQRNQRGAAVFNTFVFSCFPDTIDPRGPKKN